MTPSAVPSPPQARREPVDVGRHGRERVDAYTWMHDDTAGLLQYLAAERAYYDTVTSPLQPLRDRLYDELASHVAPTDVSVSWRHGTWEYFSCVPEGKQYRDLCRRPVGGNDADAEVVIDGNELADGHAYFGFGIREVSPDDRLLAYSVDTEGNEVYELRFRDLDTGRDLPDVLPRSYYGGAWSAASDAFLYVVHDDAYRPYQVWRHVLGTAAADDALVVEETDQHFALLLRAARSGEVAVITATSRDTTECLVLPTADFAAEPAVVAPREKGIEYHLDHVPGEDGGWLYVVTNAGAEEFQLVRTPLRSPGRDSWEPVLPEDPARRLVDVDAFRTHLVVTARRGGAPCLLVVDLATGTAREETAGLDAGTIRLASNDRLQPIRDPFDADAVTVTVESLISPAHWWSLDLASGSRTLRREQEVPGHDPDRYVTERIEVTARDGVAIPVVLARRADVPLDGSAPLLLYGYGAYEICIDPTFTVVLPTLLDHGVVYAIAQVRGGGERGRNWWRDGHLRAKRNTFTDFVDVADGLADDLVDGSRIVSRGASAGGLLQGAVFAMAPRRFRAMIAEVPFVDVITTMLDPSLPLTVGEWDEWGDPRDPGDYDYMASYSPYENVPDEPWPDLLVTGSVQDPRVLVREPAKWVAKLRTLTSGEPRLLFRAEVGAGSHGGPSGRFSRLRYDAEILAFVLDEVGLAELD